MKTLDGRQEALQRHLRLVLSRKKGFVDAIDWERSKNLFAQLVAANNAFASLLSKGFVI